MLKFMFGAPLKPHSPTLEAGLGVINFGVIGFFQSMPACSEIETGMLFYLTALPQKSTALHFSQGTTRRLTI